MKELFVSYSYIGKSDGVIYQGFSNATFGSEINMYDDLTFIELITVLCDKSCLKHYGFDTCTTTVLFFYENAKANSNDLRPGFDDVASESDKQV